MKLDLSCYCCGGIDFKFIAKKELNHIEGEVYLSLENSQKTMVVCETCGLEDYILNLSLKLFDYKEDVI